MAQLRLLTAQSAHEAIHIAEDDMIHITWHHATLRINVTGLIYLVEFLNGNYRRAAGFDVYGTPDDGYQIWVQDVGLRLSPADCRRFKDMLVSGLAALKTLGKRGDADHLPPPLKLTVPVETVRGYSAN